MSTVKKAWTWGQMWTSISEELEIADEDFVSKAKCREWANEGIDDAESLIHTLNEEYFLTYQAPVEFEVGIDAVDLPDNIYASKIRSIIISNGRDAYELKRLTSLEKFITYRQSRLDTTLNKGPLVYFPVNESESAPRCMFSPATTTDEWSYEFWYYRNANRLEDDEDVCDIPEFTSYVFQWIRERVEWKRRAGSATHRAAQVELERLRAQMMNTLKDMVIDGDNGIEQDLSHYEEHE